MIKKIIFIMFFLFIVSNLFAITGGQGKDDYVNSNLYVSGITESDDIVNNSFVCANICTSYNETELSLSNVAYSTMNISISSTIVVNCTVNLSSGTITVLNDGLYSASWSMSATGSNGNDIHGGLSINGAEPDGCYEGNFSMIAGNYIPISKNVTVRLYSGDIVCTQWENITGANAITPEFYSLNLYRISE